MFERESGDFDPELDPLADYASGSIPMTGASMPPAGKPHPYPPSQAPQAQGAQGPKSERGNRPADQARQTDSASQAKADWRASDAATDFLGLDDAVFVDESLSAEFTPVTDDFAPAADDYPAADEDYAAFGDEPAYEQVPMLDGLEGLEGLGLAEAATEADQDNWLLDLDDAADPRARGELELPEQLEASYSEPDTKGKLGAWVVRGTAAAAVLAVCVTLIKLYSATEDAPVVEPPVPVEPTRPLARNEGLSLPGDGASGPVTENPFDTEGSGTAAVQRQTSIQTRPGPAFDPSLQGETTTEAIQRTIRDSQGTESVAADVGGEVRLDEDGRPIAPETLDPTGEALGVRDPFDEVALDDAPGSATTASGAQAAAQGSEQGPVVLTGELTGSGVGGENAAGGLRYASVSQMAGMWDGTTIPIDSVDSSIRIVTPHVGRVRAVMTTGEIFEGRMYAVGEGRIWIDNGLGRMAFAGADVASVQHVLSPDGSPGLGEPGSQEYAGLPRVRAKAPGGVFFGKLIHEDGDRVTLITEEGARLTLDRAQIDPAPSTKRVIVRGYDPQSAQAP